MIEARLVWTAYYTHYSRNHDKESFSIQVIVIGATNRIDHIDPALRRPGRFDRELLFKLPSQKDRRSIIDIHTRNWNPPLRYRVVLSMCAFISTNSY
jgi:SpoVK/Ycf46/Vps4 family AAA+-type ATPase